MPVGTAKAWAWVAASRSPKVAPGSTRTVWESGSTSTVFMALNEIIKPPSPTAFPAMLWPAPKMESRTPCSAANFTDSLTSPSARQTTMRSGRRSIMAFHSDRASSYSADSGVSRSPTSASPRAATASSLTGALPPSGVVRFGMVSSTGAFLVSLSVHARRRMVDHYSDRSDGLVETTIGAAPPSASSADLESGGTAS